MRRVEADPDGGLDYGKRYELCLRRMEALYSDDEAFAEKLDIKVWKRLFVFFKPYRKKVIWLILLMTFAGVIDASVTMLQKYAIDSFIVENTKDGLVMFGVIAAALMIIQAVNTFFLVKFANDLSISTCYDFRREGFVHLQKLSFSYYDRTQVGWIVARLASDTYSLAGVMTWSLFDFVWAFSLVLFVAVYMLILNWKLALIMLLVMPVLALCTVYFQKRILKYQREVIKYNSRITGALGSCNPCPRRNST